MDTKKIVSSALFELASEKRLEKITITDVLDRSGVSRSTFYAHFQDKYDALNWFCATKANAVLADCAAKDWYHVLISLNSFAYNNRGFFRVYLKDDTDVMKKYRMDYIGSFLKRAYFPEKAPEENLTRQERLTLIHAAAGVSEMLKEWLMEDCKMPVVEFSYLGYSFLPGERRTRVH